MKTIMKSAAAVFAFFAMTGASFAQDNHIVDQSAMLQNLYVAMERNNANTFELVLATAEARMEERLAKIDNNALDNNANEPASMFVLALN